VEELPEHTLSSTKLSRYLNQENRSKVSSRDFVTERCVVHFQCRFSEFETKLQTSH